MLGAGADFIVKNLDPLWKNDRKRIWNYRSSTKQ